MENRATFLQRFLRNSILQLWEAFKASNSTSRWFCDRISVRTKPVEQIQLNRSNWIDPIDLADDHPIRSLPLTHGFSRISVFKCLSCSVGQRLGSGLIAQCDMCAFSPSVRFTGFAIPVSCKTEDIRGAFNALAFWGVQVLHFKL